MMALPTRHRWRAGAERRWRPGLDRGGVLMPGEDICASSHGKFRPVCATAGRRCLRTDGLRMLRVLSPLWAAMGHDRRRHIACHAPPSISFRRPVAPLLVLDPSGLRTYLG